MTKDERRRRRNAVKKARYKARHPEKARAKNRARKARYRRKYPEKVRAAKKRYREKYPDRVRESQRRYEERHKEQRAVRKREWAKKNRARCVVSERRYREKNKERIRLREREYRKNNRVRILEYKRMYNRTAKGRAAHHKYYTENREQVLMKQKKYYLAHRAEVLARTRRRYWNKRRVPPQTLAVVLTDCRTQPSLETYLNNFCASLPSVEPSVERQKTEEKIKALGPLKLTIPLEDFRKSIPKTFENFSFCESFLEETYTLTDMDSGEAQVMEPPDLGDLSFLQDLLKDMTPDDWQQVMDDVEDSSSFDLEALVPPEDVVHDMSPDEGVDLLYDLVT